MGSRIWAQDLQLLRELLEHPTTALRILKFEKLKIKFSKNKFLKKPEKKRHISKITKRFEQPQLEARSLAISESTMTAPTTWGLELQNFQKKNLMFPEIFLKK